MPYKLNNSKGFGLAFFSLFLITILIVLKIFWNPYSFNYVLTISLLIAAIAFVISILGIIYSIKELRTQKSVKTVVGLTLNLLMFTSLLSLLSLAAYAILVE